MSLWHTYARMTCSLFIVAGNAGATELVYVPVNPSFGGNPQYGSVLMGTASATNKHNVSASSLFNQSPLEQFNQTLERTVLNQLASAATSKFIGADGKLMPGTFSTANFNITITDLGGGVLHITTTDKKTGATTTFDVSQ